MSGEVSRAKQRKAAAKTQNGSNKNESQESTERAVLRWNIAAPLLFQPNLSIIYCNVCCCMYKV